ncbi:alpha-1,4-glucan--maltose-1-phosphate maltosyltransferase [Trebonia kvetii]|uniref:alpha-1,4-glucan--maltose-1-phosphate maltosyltransferase n=1 Tax=Trebonia kvetii TaxID=2480626 RepID=UPI0016525CAC|nr:alpha-1,4-glucan--maltose-1-phosphate maltosyltransferase [Trebonia kvetii]
MIGRIPILDIEPAVECGRRQAKAVVGETLQVSATIIVEGHGVLGAGVVLRDPEGRLGPLVRMRELSPGSDRYGADVTVTSEGIWYFHVESWADPIAHWDHDAGIKIPRGQDVELMLAEGALLFERAARSIRQPPGAARPAAARSSLMTLARRLRDRSLPPWDRLDATRAPRITAILGEYPLRDLVTRSGRLPVRVERQRALYGSWYEFFPRSEGVQFDPMGRREPISGTLRTAARRLEAIAEMGFDVVYLPPVHPIGTTFRKGRNNTLEARQGDPGVPWAIGAPEGGHDAIHPDLGTFADFDAFVARARELGMEVAIDLALQASPDHPWVKEHPEWFTTRADGSIAYAENPPKKYQDIFPLNFDNDPEGIYAEIERIVRLWMGHGVRIFRVDNPHTKPVRFWERLLTAIRQTDPDVLFLAEAFTRPAMMATLGMVGFHQSYTYFTWRNTSDELTGYLRELSGPASAYMRPNFFANTPDILNEYLQHGGPAAFKIRAVLAAMLSPSWGIYSGYELCENTPLRPGSEEYLDSEKYQYRPRDWDTAARDGLGISGYIADLNRIRRSHVALHWLRNLRFHHVDQPELICFSKRVNGASRSTERSSGEATPRAGGQGGDAADTVLVVVNLDPHQAREATVWLDMPALGMDWHDGLSVTDELTGENFSWGQANYVRLDPAVQPAHIFTVSREQG